MVAVLVHEVVAVTPELLAQLSHDAFAVLLGEVCVPEVDALPAVTRGQKYILLPHNIYAHPHYFLPYKLVHT